MIAPARNGPCPCDSGKRYKDCHGALAAPSGPPAADVAIGQRMAAALAAQQAGRYAEAIALYEAVIAQDPRTFDAVHMLGVVHFQRGDFERAQELVAAALAIMPAQVGARHNLQLIESALERRAIERAICDETLPRLAKRCVAPATPDVRERWRGTTIDLIASKTDMRGAWPALERFARWLGTAPTVWVHPETTPPATSSWRFRKIDPGAGAIPQHRAAIFYGADISPASWYARSLAADVALYCDADDPCLLVDRIAELAHEGRTPLHLLFASPALARRIGLPGRVADLPSVE
jgi:tetratricopeptide (TPR) repeat protein